MVSSLFEGTSRIHSNLVNTKLVCMTPSILIHLFVRPNFSSKLPLLYDYKTH